MKHETLGPIMLAKSALPQQTTDAQGVVIPVPKSEDAFECEGYSLVKLNSKTEEGKTAHDFEFLEWSD